MQYSALLVLAATASSVTASLGQHAFPLPKRAMGIAARQTDTSSSGDDDGDDESAECASTAVAIESTMPTPAADIEDYFSTYTYTDTSCVVIATSVASDWDAYTSSLEDWFSSSSAEVVSFVMECSDYGYDVNTGYYVCSDDATSATSGVASATAVTTTSGASAATGTTSTETGTATTKGSSTSSTRTTASGTVTATAGAAVRDVGFVGALLAGALGVAVAL